MIDDILLPGPGHVFSPDSPVSPDAMWRPSVRRKLVRHVQYALGRSRADAEDATQETLLAIVRVGWDPTRDPIPDRFAFYVAGREARRLNRKAAFHRSCITADGNVPEAGCDAQATHTSVGEEAEAGGGDDVEVEALEMLERRLLHDEPARKLVAARLAGIEDGDELAAVLGFANKSEVYNLNKRVLRHAAAVGREIAKRGGSPPRGYRGGKAR